MDQSLVQTKAVEKLEKMEADLDCIDALQFFNDNLIDINMREKQH